MLKYILAAFVVIFLYTNVDSSQKYLNVTVIILIVGLLLKNNVPGQIKTIFDRKRDIPFTENDIYG